VTQSPAPEARSAEGTSRPPDALFWYGCNMTRHAEIIRISAHLLACAGVPAAPIGGPGACCGSPKESQPRIAEGMARRTMSHFNDSGAKQVITWCPTCHMNLDDFMGATQEPRFGHSHVTEALWQRRDALAPLLTRPVAGRVLVDTHTGFNDRAPVNEAVLGLLRLVPGLEVLEHPYRGASYMCFGLAGVPGALPAHLERLVAAAREVEADTIVSIFHSCHRELVGLEKTHGFQVRNWAHILGESAGLPHGDEYKEWRNSADPAALIGSERIAAAGADAVEKYVLPELNR